MKTPSVKEAKEQATMELNERCHTCGHAMHVKACPERLVYTPSVEYVCGCADRQDTMPRILSGDVVDLDGFNLRPVLPESLRVLQNNDGVKAIYRAIWRRQ